MGGQTGSTGIGNFPERASDGGRSCLWGWELEGLASG